MDLNRALVVLGSTDPEMVAIRQMCTDLLVTTVQATRDGRPVRPGELADEESVKEIYKRANMISANRIFLVEQMGRKTLEGSWILERYAIADGRPVTIVEVDHHDPEQVWADDVPMWQRSSLGQLATAFGVELGNRSRWIGALDHDLPGALSEARRLGELESVLMIYASGASHLFGGVEPEVYVQQARETEQRLAQLGTVFLGSEEVVPVYLLPPDPTTAGATGEHYPLPALPLALALAGKAGLSVIRRKDGALAWRLQCATASMVRYFVDEYRDVLRGSPPPDAPYGQPERGFAGGRLTVAAEHAMIGKWSATPL